MVETLEKIITAPFIGALHLAEGGLFGFWPIFLGVVAIVLGVISWRQSTYRARWNILHILWLAAPFAIYFLPLFLHMVFGPFSDEWLLSWEPILFGRLTPFVVFLIAFALSFYLARGYRAFVTVTAVLLLPFWFLMMLYTICELGVDCI